MQYESTPFRQKCEVNTTPCSTAVNRRQGRKRISIRTPLQEDDHVRKVANSVGSTQSDRFSLQKTTPKTESPCENNGWKHPFSHLQEQESPKDVFLDNKYVSDHQLQNPAQQFHNAVKRLAFESLSINGPNAVSPSRNSHTIDNQKKDSARPCNFSRRLRTDPNTKEATKTSALRECDITSARRDRSSLAAYEDSLATPVRTQRYAGPPTPVSLPRNHQPVRHSSQRAIRPNRNFSRPVRPLHNQSSEQTPRTATSSPRQKHNKETELNDTGIANADHKPSRVVENMPAPRLGNDKLPDEHSLTSSGPMRGSEPQKQTPKAIQPTKSPGTSRPSTYVKEEDLTDNRRQLKHWQIWSQRIAIMLIVLGINIGLGLAYFRSFKHPYLLGILVFMKSKDILSTIADLLGILHYHFHRLLWPPREPDPRWILSLVCAYAETEEQIMKTIMSLVNNVTIPHRQVICIILDGKPRDIVSKMDTVRVEFKRPYVTWRGVQGNLHIHAGTIRRMPTILICKAKNAGKKDSLILGHDLFNYPRKDMPHSTKLLREEIWQLTMPHLVSRKQLTAFDFIFCTDADSTIHETCLQKLANTLCQTRGAIAGCGVLFAELGQGWTEYAPWHLFQQFQYTFGQYVRRQAESTFGRVTCLPGCVTMLVVRSEAGDALSEYAKPVTGHNLLRHQVQYLGTDRRLTWCMLSQNKHLRTIFVPEALSETVTPSSLSHYLSQRRRWASNAYFNDFFYLFGPQQRLTTRLFAAIDILRLTLVFYRVFNTAYFIHGLATNFYVIKIIPTLIVTKTPATWYLLLVLIKEPILRKRLHKIILGMLINQLFSPILSVIVFVNVLLHVGSQAWGKTGASTQGNSVPSLHHNTEPSKSWTPGRLAQSVREAIRGLTPARNRKDRRKALRNLSPSTTDPPKSKNSDATTVSSRDCTTGKLSKAESRARSTSILSIPDLNRNHSELTTSNPQQTPVRQLFRTAHPTLPTTHKRIPHPQDDSNRKLQETPTRRK